MFKELKININYIIFFIYIFFYSNTLLLANNVKNLNQTEIVALSNENSNDSKLTTEYILGPGDIIFIEFRGVELFTDNYPINSEGYLFLPELGNFYTTGLTIEELKNKLSTIYKDIIYNPKLYLSIAAYRPVSVYVHGEVNKPGLYTLNYTTRGSTINRKSESAILAYDIAMPSLSPKVFDAIKKAEGVTQNADLSNIKIIRKNSQSQGGGQIQTNIDLITLIKDGDQTQNIRLFDSDSIFIPKSTTILKDQIDSINKTNLNPDSIIVYIGGNVDSPGAIVLKKGSTLVQGIIATGGNKTTSSIGKVEFIRFNARGKVIKNRFNLNLASIKDSPENPILKNGDIINVRKSILSKTTEVISEVGVPIIQGYGIYSIFN